MEIQNEERVHPLGPSKASDNGVVRPFLELDELYQQILERTGEDTQREGLRKTPHRAAEALKFMTQGYHQTLKKSPSSCCSERRCSTARFLKPNQTTL